MFAIFIFFFIIILIILALYVYYSYTWQTIGKKLGYKYSWIAWIPLVQLFLYPILAKRRWGWGFLLILPTTIYIFIDIFFKKYLFLLYASLSSKSGASFLSILNSIPNLLLFIGIFSILSLLAYTLIIVWTWNIFERRNYPGAFSLVYTLLIIPGLNIIGVIGYLVIIGFVAFSDNKKIKDVKKKSDDKNKKLSKNSKTTKKLKKSS